MISGARLPKNKQTNGSLIGAELCQSAGRSSSFNKMLINTLCRTTILAL